MAKLGWTLNELKSELARRKQIKAWVIFQEHVHRRERYFLADHRALAIDQDRDVRSQSITAKIMVWLPKNTRQGEISKKLFPSLPLAPQLDAAVEAALQTDHQAWELPTEVPENLPQLATTDPRIGEDIERVMGELTDQISLATRKKRETLFNSAELFVSIHDSELHLSNGLAHRSSQSRIYTEAAYSLSRKNSHGKIESDEYLSTAWTVSLDDISIPRLFDETSERAIRSLDVEKPVTGKYAVIVDADVLSTLLNGHLSQLSGFNSYSKLPFIPPGSEFVPQAEGDLLSVILDPALEFGADTTAISEQGVIQKPMRLVENNLVLATCADQQYAGYLGMPATTSRGNIVIAPGKLTHRELTEQAPLVIEILQFSALFPDPNSGTFSSEIRLAKLYDNSRGTVRYLKGGSLSGSINENFRKVRLSKNLVKRAQFGSHSAHGYYGPEHALLNEVSIVG